ncbi:Anaphase-promoting complex subunit 15/MND2 [Penicillium longicatenatum]|nr:Anaphase-promoting complex subunit 15/MND2 [Penicillium longicatenatum]
MLSLPFLTPRDSHELWFGASQPYRSTSPQQSHTDAGANLARRNGNNTVSHRAFMPSRSPANGLAALAMEERALRARKQNIASFGYSWIKPAGCSKTMLGMKEEEAEREEALAAAAAEMNAEGMMEDDMGMTQGEEGEEVDQGMERDLDDEIPDADAEGLIEEGEEGLEEEDVVDEEGYMERDLDDDIPEGYPDDDYEESGLYEQDDEDFDNQPDLDAEVPEAGEEMSEMSRDLDVDIPDAAESGSEQGEWQHTDTEEESEGDEEESDNVVRNRLTENFRTSTPNSRAGMLPTPPMRRARETEAQSRFINRWSGGGDALDSSSMFLEDEDLRASVTSQSSRRSGFARRFPRHVGRPRDSFN